MKSRRIATLQRHDALHAAVQVRNAQCTMHPYYAIRLRVAARFATYEYNLLEYHSGKSEADVYWSIAVIDYRGPTRNTTALLRNNRNKKPPGVLKLFSPIP